MTTTLDSTLREADLRMPDLRRTTPTTLVTEYPASWVSFAGVLGGLVAAHAVTAAERYTDRSPATATTHFHAPVLPDVPVEYEVRELRSGRSATSVAVIARQLGKARASAQVLLAAPGQDRRPTVWSQPLDPADLPTPDSLDRFALPEQFVPFARFVEIRPVNDARPGAAGSEPRFVAWLRNLAGASGAEAVAIALDTFPPSLFAMWSTPQPVPTAELTMHFGNIPDPEAPNPWYLVDQHTTWASVDYCVDDAVVYGADGRLVAQARQLRRVLG